MIHMTSGKPPAMFQRETKGLKSAFWHRKFDTLGKLSSRGLNVPLQTQIRTGQSELNPNRQGTACVVPRPVLNAPDKKWLSTFGFLDYGSRTMPVMLSILLLLPVTCKQLKFRMSHCQGGRGFGNLYEVFWAANTCWILPTSWFQRKCFKIDLPSKHSAKCENNLM